MELTAEDPNTKLDFVLNDFGARGTTSTEQSGIGGAAHLVNFLGSDTIFGALYAKKYYNAKMHAFSIPAAEHSTITSWGKDSESKAYENMIDKFSGPNKLYAVVSDSYDIWNAVKNIWCSELTEKVIQTEGRLVIRPDSENPTKVAVDICDIIANKIGYAVNSKGYKVLHPSFRVIQGDGMNIDTIKILFENLKDRGFSIENVAIGMGGGLLQSVNRDTLGYAMKANAISYGYGFEDVYKKPLGDSKKASKAGRLNVIKVDNDLVSIRSDSNPEVENYLQTVYKNGKLLIDHDFNSIKKLAA